MATEGDIVRQAAEAVSARCGVKPEVVVVTGTGLDSLAESFGAEETIGYSEVPGFPVPAEESHPGRLVLGTTSGRGVAVLHGRAHTYEGHSAAEVVRPLRCMAMLGAKTLFATNCSGSLNPEFEVPSMMLITDHINMTSKDPAAGPEVPEFGQRFADMAACYDPQLLAAAREFAEKSSEVPVCEGIYAAVAGPTLETSAERRMLRTCGADAVGMSTVHEVIAARQAGMRVLGLSALANDATGSPTQEAMDIGALMEATKRIACSMAPVIAGILAEMG